MRIYVDGVDLFVSETSILYSFCFGFDYSFVNLHSNPATGRGYLFAFKSTIMRFVTLILLISNRLHVHIWTQHNFSRTAYVREYAAPIILCV